MELNWVRIVGFPIFLGFILMFFPAKVVAGVSLGSFIAGYFWLLLPVTLSGRNLAAFLFRDSAHFSHQRQVASLITWILAGVFAILIAIGKEGGTWGHVGFSWFHRSLALAMVSILLLMLLRFNGYKYAIRHQSLGRWLKFFYGVTLVTGAMLIDEKFHFFDRNVFQ